MQEQFDFGEIQLDIKQLNNKHCKTLLVFGHGAGAPLHHAHMESICAALLDNNIATLRFNFPFAQRGGGRDSNATTLAVINQIWQWSLENIDAQYRFVGGHSFGGRMATHAVVSQELKQCIGVICYSFPLHPPKKPSSKRCDHFSQITHPMIFLNGSRDALAQNDLLQSVVQTHQGLTLIPISGADHSFKTLKRDATKVEHPYQFAAQQVDNWTQQQITRDKN